MRSKGLLNRLLLTIMQVFGGNMDFNTERRHYLNQPVVARFVRIHPKSWNKKIGMRAAILGCPHKGACGKGFMQVNQEAACGKWCSVVRQRREVPRPLFSLPAT